MYMKSNIMPYAEVEQNNMAYMDIHCKQINASMGCLLPGNTSQAQPFLMDGL